MSQETLSDDEKIVHVLNRLTPGATSDLVNEVRKEGLKGWFARQLKGDAREPELLAAALRNLDSLGRDCKEIHDTYDKPIPDGTAEPERRKLEALKIVPARELCTAILLRALYGANPVLEMSCDFFRNHFSVSIDKDEVRFLVTDWDRRVIRRHALGNFGDLLKATAHHAAMLFYLDNHLSRRPPTKSELQMIESEARRTTKSKERGREAVEIARQRGLNENYARELLELHTLGVDRHYTQGDVLMVARCLTGWTICRRPEQWGDFEFNVDVHSTENKTFLGAEVKGKRDPSEGEWVLEVLSRHKGTALFVAAKLCRWLVSDDPDEKMVMRVAKVFNQSVGDLPKTLTAIVEDPDFFKRGHFRAKYKRPWEFVVSALRATKAEVTSFDGIGAALEAMNEPLYRCADPTGYYDQAEAWRDPGSMAIRWAFCSDLVAGRIAGAKIPASFYADVPADAAGMKTELARRILPVAGIGTQTSQNLDALVSRARKPSGPMIVGVLLGSPDFQKQ